MKVRYKQLDEKAVVPYKKIEKDFCYDVVATSLEMIDPLTYKYGIGLAFEIESNDLRWFREDFKKLFKTEVYVSIDLRPRSSVCDTGLILSNCEGTIDELYRGEVSAVFYHVQAWKPPYKVGERIGQIKLGFTLPMEFIVAAELSQTERGTGGYGHTGK